MAKVLHHKSGRWPKVVAHGEPEGDPGRQAAAPPTPPPMRVVTKGWTYKEREATLEQVRGGLRGG